MNGLGGRVVRGLTSAVAVLLALGCGPPREWTAMSPTGNARLRIEEVDGQSCVQFRGRPQGCYDAIALDGFVMSPDGRRLAFPARNGESWHVMWNDTLGPPWAGVAELALAPNGDRLAYAAEDAAGWQVVTDRHAEPVVDSLLASSLQWDPEGRRVGYVAVRGGERFVVVGGQSLGPYTSVGSLRFDGEGTFAFLASSEDRVVLVVNGIETRRHRVIDHLVPVRTGRGFAFAFSEDDGWWIHGPDHELGPFGSVRELVPFDPEVGPAAIVASDGGVQVVIGRDHESPAFQEADLALPDAGATGWGYIGRDSLSSIVVVAGDTVSQERWASDLTLSDAGGRWSFLSHRADGVYVVDDTAERRFDHVVAETLVWVRGASRWAALVGDLDRRRLSIAVEGVDRLRAVEWAEIVDITTGLRASRSEAALPDDALRTWVAAQATTVLTERAEGTGAGSVPRE